MVAIAIPMMLLDSLKLTWSHIWFLVGGAVLTLSIGINELRRFRTQLATMLANGVGEPTTGRGAGTDAGLRSNPEARENIDTAADRVPAWADLETAVDAQEWHRVIERRGPQRYVSTTRLVRRLHRCKAPMVNIDVDAIYLEDDEKEPIDQLNPKQLNVSHMTGKLLVTCAFNWRYEPPRR
ncbi:hypothetical protein CEP52_009787 [Fusarium oligoseptatum]|uniref:Uncharacterized protein n=1 Tax=Fusarium oligoseptatum TaxID=2604345 RepID=A0A428TBH7_9HYPO|nr:hypothetical protein CEP52_009787 [Fusarium oligoseptatum]